jgi:hypothetical protein
MPKALVVRHYRPVTFACEFTDEHPQFPPTTFSKTFPFKGKFLSSQLLKLKLKTCVPAAIANPPSSQAGDVVLKPAENIRSSPKTYRLKKVFNWNEVRISS